MTKEPKRETIGRRIRAARINAGVRPKVLAARLKMSPWQLNEWELGVRDPNAQSRYRVAVALGLMPDEFE